jgi:NAD(P)-dependent dehydrogenase (short-subunit alcohol dehydrogenase family)
MPDVEGIRVNVISPGPIETLLYDKLGLDATAQKATVA